MDLAEVLAAPADDPLRLRQGVVTQASPLLVQVGGADTATSATTIATYAPVVGDVVSVLEQGADRLVLGPTGSTVWSAPGSFSNSWVDFGAGTRTTRYRRIGDRVEIEGLVKSGTLNATVFTLPAGFRPPLNLHFASQSNITFGLIYITTAGDVQFFGSSNAYASLNCSFSVTA